MMSITDQNGKSKIIFKRNCVQKNRELWLSHREATIPNRRNKRQISNSRCFVGDFNLLIVALTICCCNLRSRNNVRLIIAMFYHHMLAKPLDVRTECKESLNLIKISIRSHGTAFNCWWNFRGGSWRLSDRMQKHWSTLGFKQEPRLRGWTVSSLRF